MKTRAALVSAIAAAVLAACGGGSGPDSSAMSPQSADLATADSVDLTDSAATTAAVAAKPAMTLDTDVKSKKSSAAVAPSNKLYIVQMADLPTATYDGRVSGFAATRAAKGSKLAVRSKAVSDYRAYLRSKQDSLMKSAGISRKVYSYQLAFNGFAAEMTDAQAQKLKMTKGVLSVTKDPLLQLKVASTPDFLGLTGTSGFYAKTGAKGENVVIGLIDSGVWPENNAFTDKQNGSGVPDSAGATTVYNPLPGWNGTCQTGSDPSFTTANCNNKLIGARFYDQGWGGDSGITNSFPFEFLSPRDWAGHGSHTSSTAGGNENVPVTGLYQGFGSISGIAPRARIAMYKVCWASQETNGGCFGTDTMAAVDDAINDGVDVINFSVGGSLDQVFDGVESAFFNAAAAGIFVAAASGNEGPTPSTTNHPAPWLTTVAAGTYNRAVVGGYLTTGSTTYSGVTNVPGSISASMIDSKDAGLPGADPTMLARCFGSADGQSLLDSTKVTGKILVCDRGANFLINKSIAAQEAGAVGVVITNVPGGATTTLSFGGGIPALHTVVANRDAIQAYANGTNSGTIGGNLSFSVPAPYMADFSSRGPSLALGGNLLKPDITAPGVDVLAAVAPPNNGGRTFDVYQGTSMATPHIAGVAALFKQAHPDWSPMAIKSALMTTAYDVLDGANTDPNIIFAQGAGFVKPTAALDPGLVFDSDFYDWVSFLCGTGDISTLYCTQVFGVPIGDPKSFNVASIAVADLAGSQVITRKVTNVSNKSATYSGSVKGLAGFTVTMSPTKIVIPAGATKTITLTIKRTKGELETYTGGQFTLTDGKHIVRVPMVMKPTALAAPAEVSGSYQVKFGYSGPFSATVSGMVPATLTASSVVQNPTPQGSIPNGSDTILRVMVPDGTTYARFQITDADVGVANSDFDMYVFDGSGNFVGQSGGPTASEEVSAANPAPGNYYVVIRGFNVPNGTQGFHLFSWMLNATKVGNLAVSAPTSAQSGGSATVKVTPSTKLESGMWLGAITYGGNASTHAPTIVRIDKMSAP